MVCGLMKTQADSDALHSHEVQAEVHCKHLIVNCYELPAEMKVLFLKVFNSNDI